MLSPFDAEDLTQEVLIKMVTKLAQFQGRSSFRTWLYRITFNHFLNTKKNALEEVISSLEEYGNALVFKNKRQRLAFDKFYPNPSLYLVTL